MMSASSSAWPGGHRVAVAITILFETWSDGKSPSYSVQTTNLKPGAIDHAGASWASYGGKAGVWRLIRTLDRHGVPATFFTNARCVEQYPEAVAAIVRSGHDLGGHGYTQDGLLAYMEPEEERATIRRSADLLASAAGKPLRGWLSPVLAYTPHTAGLLAEAGFAWHSDVNDADLPVLTQTAHGPIVGIPTSEFTDNRVLRASPRDFVEVYCDTFDFLYRHESKSLLVLALHCHFGGRPLMSAALDQVLTHIRRCPDVWFARHDELAACTVATG